MPALLDHKLRLRWLLPLLLALGACSSGPFAPREDPRLAELSSSMAQCLEGQARTAEMLREQQARLQQQQDTLDELAGLMAPQAEEPVPPEVVPAAVLSGEVCAAPPAEEPVPGTKLLVGELEEVWLESLEMALPARIDTGAETASIDARNIEVFERDGRRWVRFEILHPVSGEPLPMERRLKRMVSIVQATSPEAERRPVIKLGITIGHISQTAEFTLSDRSHLDYQVLVGRNILQDVMVVDVSRKHIAPYQLPDGAVETP
jgi:hypothetical protein